MKNTITINGFRTSVSSSGNVEWFEFTIASELKLHDDTVKELVNAHGLGGQDSSFDYEMNQNGDHIYRGTSKRYSD